MRITAICIPLVVGASLSFSQTTFWQATNGPEGDEIRGLAVNSDGEIFAATAMGGVCRSTDNGEVWTQVNDGLFSPPVVGRFAIGSSGTIFVTIGNSDWAVARSTNKGQTWTRLFTGFSTVNELAINSSGHLFAATFNQGVFRSTDDGQSWTAGFGLPDYINTVSVGPDGVVFAGTAGYGVYRSNDNGKSQVPS